MRRCPAVFNSEHFKEVVQLKNLPMQNSAMIKGLVMTAACVTDKEMQKQYLNEILVPITEKYVLKHIFFDYSINYK